jgi:hypothetical protein
MNWTKKETFYLFGKGFVLKSILCEFTSDRAFNGDGYSIYVIEMTEELIKYISTNLNDIIEIYPIKQDYRKRWIKVGWQKTPLVKEEEEFYDFAIDAKYLYDNKPSLVIDNANKSLSYFIEMMNDEGNYYSYIYNKWDNETIGDIDFFVFDLEKGVLVLINHQI